MFGQQRRRRWQLFEQLTPSTAVVVVCVLLGLLGCGAGPVRPVTAYCSTHHFAQAAHTNAMQFTKEAVSREYTTMRDPYKSLHCCAKGYQSIEW